MSGMEGQSGKYAEQIRTLKENTFKDITPTWLAIKHNILC